MEIENGVIKSTSLGYEDHGLSVWLIIDFDGTVEAVHGNTYYTILTTDFKHLSANVQTLRLYK